MSDWTITQGDCLEVLRTLPDASVDAIVTDPPYGLAFMGKRWDYDVPSVDVWRECLRVLKPGGHLLAFAGTRTQHRMAVRIEDAGFEIRDMIAWVYGSGFPKSLDVSKAIDKAAGAEREVVGQNPNVIRSLKSLGKTTVLQTGDRFSGDASITAPATEAARQWSGWGTALKPALEPLTVARKPLDGTVADNVLAHGTGALNVDGCRVGMREKRPLNRSVSIGFGGSEPQGMVEDGGSGRWPANLIHDGSEEVVGLFPETASGKLEPHHVQGPKCRTVYAGGLNPHCSRSFGGDSGSAARFFYTAKASTNDRDHGATGLHWFANESRGSGWRQITREHWQRLHEANEAARKAKLPPPHRIATANIHTTVKPTDLMRYLVTLVTPQGGLVLDPFTGSGSTGRGARLAGMRFHGIERDPDYVTIARARIAAAHLWTPDSVTTENDPRQMDLLP